MATQQAMNRILIPTTQLSILNLLNPNLRVYEVSGAGSFSGVQTRLPFTYGEFKGVLTGRAEISWAANAMVNSIPLG